MFLAIALHLNPAAPQLNAEASGEGEREAVPGLECACRPFLDRPPGRDEAPSEQAKGLIEIEPDTTNQVNLVGLKYSPDYRAVVERANGEVGLNLSYKWDDEAALNVYFRSDQFPFALKDIPAMWWFTGFHPDYHQMTDTVDKINFEKMAKILRLAYLTGWDFADSDRPLRFIANPAAQR